jgi:hypothetical protein
MEFLKGQKDGSLDGLESVQKFLIITEMHFYPTFPYFEKIKVGL